MPSRFFCHHDIGDIALDRGLTAFSLATLAA